MPISSNINTVNNLITFSIVFTNKNGGGVDSALKKVLFPLWSGLYTPPPSFSQWSAHFWRNFFAASPSCYYDVNMTHNPDFYGLNANASIILQKCNFIHDMVPTNLCFMSPQIKNILQCVYRRCSNRIFCIYFCKIKCGKNDNKIFLFHEIFC